MAQDEFQPVSVQHRTGWEFLTSNSQNFSDVASNQITSSADFVGPKGSFAATLQVAVQINAGFVGPRGSSEAILNMGRDLRADFTGPFGAFDAILEVEVPLEIAADGFVGLVGSTSASLQFFEASAAFVGPRGHMDALLFGDGAITGSFVGPTGYTEVVLKNSFELESAFVGPFGGFDAQLGVDDRTAWFDFVGPMGNFESNIENKLALTSGFVGPKGKFDANIRAPYIMSADFVGPIGDFDALLADDQLRADAFFRGPRSHFDANLELVYPSTEADLNYSFKRMSMEIIAETEVTSSLTFLLIQA